MGIIYCATNKINGEIYIGLTMLSLAERRNTHETDCLYRRGPYFYKALNKYGKENFSWRILDHADTRKELGVLEQIYIEMFGSIFPGIGYNMTTGGEEGCVCNQEVREKISNTLLGRYVGNKNPSYGIPCSAERKEKIRQSHLGKKASKETCNKISKSNKGKKRSEETKKKMREYHYKYPKKGKDSPLYGKPQRLESRLKRSRSMKGRRLGGDSNGAVKIRCVETQEIFSTIRLASIKYNIPESNISLASAGKRKSAGKLHWERYYG